MSRKTLVAPLVLLVLLVPASIALAASLPKPTNYTIKVPTSIAGVTLGMSEAKAKAAWGGSRGKCETSETTGYGRCEYGSLTGASGQASIDFKNGKVVDAQVFAGKNAAGRSVPSAAGVLERIQTKEGIGIGAGFAEVKKAYPGGEASGDGSQYRIQAKGTADFNFVFEKAKLVGFGIDDG